MLSFIPLPVRPGLKLGASTEYTPAAVASEVAAVIASRRQPRRRVQAGAVRGRRPSAVVGAR